MYGLSHGAYWGLSLEAPAPSSLPPDVLRDLERAGVVSPGTAAQVGGVVVTKRLKQTRRPELVTAPGPLALGNPQNGTYRDLYGASWALALYRGGPQLFQARAGVWVDRTDPDALGVLMQSGVRHVSLAFDQAARPVLAWEQDGAVYVRQWLGGAGYVTRGPWPGHDPLLIADAVPAGLVIGSDVHLLHLDAERAAVLARRQVSEYRAAQQVAEVTPGTVLDQVAQAYSVAQILGEADGQRVALVARYPVSQSLQHAAALSGPTGGEWRPVVIERRTPTQSGGLAVSGPTGGVYEDRAVLLRLGVLQISPATLSGPTGGEWRPVVIERQPRTQSGALGMSGPTGARYAVAVINVTGRQHNPQAALSGPTGGTYQ